MNTIALFFTNQFLPHHLEVRPVLELRHRAVFVDVVGILVVIVALVNDVTDLRLDHVDITTAWQCAETTHDDNDDMCETHNSAHATLRAAQHTHREIHPLRESQSPTCSPPELCPMSIP